MYNFFENLSILHKTCTKFARFNGFFVIFRRFYVKNTLIFEFFLHFIWLML